MSFSNNFLNVEKSKAIIHLKENTSTVYVLFYIIEDATLGYLTFKTIPVSILQFCWCWEVENQIVS